MKNVLKELWEQANSPYRFKLNTLKEIRIPAALAGVLLILKYNPALIGPAFALLFVVILFWLSAQARNNVPVQKASGDDIDEHDRSGNLFEDNDRPSWSDGPDFNIDGTPMVGMLDIDGNTYGMSSFMFDEPSVNIDGTPMFGGVDTNGNPYGITSSSSISDDN